MDTPIVIATMSALLVVLVMYTLFAPKTTRRFVLSDDSESQGPILRLVAALGDDIIGAMPAVMDQYSNPRRQYPRVESLLTRSGNPWNLTAQEFVVLRWVAAFLGALLGWGIWAIVAGSMGLPWYIVVPAVAWFCYMIPKIKYNDQAKQRDLEFRRQLPEALDLITISLSGGTTFAQSLREVIPTMNDGILKAEFINMVKMMDTGSTLKEALDEFATRAPNDGVLTFIRSVQSATEVNAPLSEILESRAKASREEFFALIHEKTAQLESKIWFILSPTLLPAVIIIAVSPSVASMIQTLS